MALPYSIPTAMYRSFLGGDRFNRTRGVDMLGGFQRPMMPRTPQAPSGGGDTGGFMGLDPNARVWTPWGDRPWDWQTTIDFINNQPDPRGQRVLGPAINASDAPNWQYPEEIQRALAEAQKNPRYPFSSNSNFWSD